MPAAIIGTAYVAFRHASEQMIYDIMVGNTGPITSRDDWPRPLAALAEEPGSIKIDESTLHIYCLCQGMDPEYVWRMEATPGLFEHLSQRWELTQVENPKWSVLDGHSSLSGIATPPWWSPKRDSKTLFFACPQSLGGLKGDRFLVALDKKRNLIFVHYWFNF